ncbi:MAG: Flp family type IVb pilin [Acidimicrobiia bacterium]
MDLFILKTWMQAKLNTDERGASVVEYTLLVALIAVVVAVVIINIGGSAKTKLTEANDCINNLTNGATQVTAC